MTTTSSVSRRDLIDALKHMEQEAGGPLSLGGFNVSGVKPTPLREIDQWDDLGSWPEWSEGELEDLEPEELRNELGSFRGWVWAQRALEWTERSVPPIVLVELANGYREVGDGRSRVSLALGLGWKTIPAVVMTQRRPM